MNCVASVSLHFTPLPTLRPICKNIVGWGCDLQARGLDELHERIVEV